MPLKLSINQTNLLQNLKMSFSGQIKTVEEILQNARRAGASEVEIFANEADRAFKVVDNGCGISDFQDLLTVAESGWNKQVQDIDHPYGMGFLSTIYAAEEVEIVSKGQKVKLQSSALLSGAEAEDPIAVTDDENTSIELFGLPAEFFRCLKEKVANALYGYPLPVYFNGVEVLRPGAIDSGRKFVSSSIGQVSLAGIHAKANSDFKANYQVDGYIFLQGQCVYRSTRHYSEIDIIHLDPTKFVARLPDRDCLIDQEAALELINAVRRELWVEWLKNQKETLPAAEFLDHYSHGLSLFCPDLLNEVDLLPRQKVSQVANYPTSFSDGEHLEPVEHHIPRAEIESGEVKIFNWAEKIEYEGQNSRVWMFLYGQRALMLDSSLPLGHWAHPYIIPIPDDDQLTIGLHVNGEKNIGRFSGRYASGDITFCESYTLSWKGLGEVRFDDFGMMDYGHGFIVPEKEQSSLPIEQCNPFEDEWGERLKDQLESEGQDFIDTLKMLRSDSAEQHFQALLESLHFKHLENKKPLLGKSFNVTVTHDGNISVAGA